MKRMVSMAAALSLVAGLTLAQTSVESENIVGYQQINASGGSFSMLAVNWDEVGGNEISIQDIIDDPLGAGLNGGVSTLSGDNIMVWDGSISKYTTYFLVDYPTAPQHNTWVYSSGSSEGETATDTFPKGTAFWLRVRETNSVDFTMLGQVPTNSVVDHTLYAGTFTMLGSAFSAEMPINSDFDWLAAGADGGGSTLGADNILVWDAENKKYTTYFLVDYPTAPQHNTWVHSAGSLEGQTTTNSIPMGSGAWYQSRGAVDITFSEDRPY